MEYIVSYHAEVPYHILAVYDASGHIFEQGQTLLHRFSAVGINQAAAGGGKPGALQNVRQGNTLGC